MAAVMVFWKAELQTLLVLASLVLLRSHCVSVYTTSIEEQQIKGQRLTQSIVQSEPPGRL